MTTATLDQDIAESRLLGFKIQRLGIPTLNAIIAECVSQGRSAIIANHNLHSLRLAQADPRLKAFFDAADYTHIDGMGVVLLARLLNVPVAREDRVTYVDWVPHLIRDAHRLGWRVFYLGSKPGIAEAAAVRFREQYPGIQIATHDGYFDVETQSAKIIDEIREFGTNLLMVGMSMPRQELWIQKFRSELGGMVILPSGAAFDYFAGAVKTPPRWAGRAGLEWAFRLVYEPRRLWKRYLVEPWFVAYEALRFVLRSGNRA